MVVMDEVQKQMGEIASKQKERIDEMGAEIRKLKAMIVKHESRIRTLETKNRDLESQVVSSGGGGGGVLINGDGPERESTAVGQGYGGGGAFSYDSETWYHGLPGVVLIEVST